MAKRWVGITVSGSNITIVAAKFLADDTLEVTADFTWSLQSGERAQAYHMLYQQISNYLREGSIKHVVVKASALSTGGVKKAHLDSAEVRGVAIAAAASVASDTHIIAKARVSKSFGDRKADDYLADNGFWNAKNKGIKLKIGSREAALLILMAGGSDG